MPNDRAPTPIAKNSLLYFGADTWAVQKNATKENKIIKNPLNAVSVLVIQSMLQK
jgi:hypothetical protein